MSVPLTLPASHPHGLLDHARDRSQGLGSPFPPTQRPPARRGPSGYRHLTRGARQQGPLGPDLRDLVESLVELASFHSKDCSRPMLDIPQQWIAESMKRAAATVGIDPFRAHPTSSAIPTAATASSTAFRSRSCSNGRDISPWPTREGTLNWQEHTTNGWPSFDDRCACLLSTGAKLRVCRSGRRAKTAIYRPLNLGTNTVACEA